MVSVITAWGVWWTGLPHSPKTDSDRLIKSIPKHSIQYITQQSLKSRAIKEKERGVGVGGCHSSASIPGGATFLSFPLPFQRSTDSNGPNCLSLDDYYWSSDCGGVLSIGLPMLLLHSQSIMINNCTQQSSNTFFNSNVSTIGQQSTMWIQDVSEYEAIPPTLPPWFIKLTQNMNSTRDFTWCDVNLKFHNYKFLLYCTV